MRGENAVVFYVFCRSQSTEGERAGESGKYNYEVRLNEQAASAHTLGAVQRPHTGLRQGQCCDDLSCFRIHTDHPYLIDVVDDFNLVKHAGS